MFGPPSCRKGFPVSAYLVAIASILLANVALSGNPSSSVSPASALARQFPGAAIPGAAYCVAKPHRDASHLLIHIRDFHSVPSMNAKATAVHRAVQADIERIVGFLMERLAVEAVYAEGIIHDRRPGSVRTDRMLAVRSGNSATMTAFHRGATAENVVRLSALERLEQERGLRILAAEDRVANDLAGKAIESRYSELTNPRRRFHILDNRENVLLERIVTRGDKFAVTVYGGAHDWADNIRLWNRKHPDRQFALVEITPASYHALVVTGQSRR